MFDLKSGNRHPTGKRCVGNRHVQTAEMWEKGVGWGSAKWCGMSCVCGEMCWDYLLAKPGELIEISEIARGRFGNIQPIQSAVVGQWVRKSLAHDKNDTE